MVAFLTALSIVSGVLLLLLALYLLVLVRPRGRMPADMTLLRDYAHRGLHGGGIPENSMAAFAKACDLGYGIELDVQLSRDGVVMVFHDYTLTRMTGTEKKLCELTAAELKDLRLGGTEETIPTFAEVLSLVNGRVPLLVELKGEDLNTALCEKVAALLSDYRGAYCLESFNPLLIGKMKTYLPNAYRGLLYTNVCRDKKKYSILNLVISSMMLNALAKPNFIAYNHLDRDALTVRIAAGLYRTPRFVWTIRGQEELERAHERGEHPIFENIL